MCSEIVHCEDIQIAATTKRWVGLKTGRANFDILLDITFLILELFLKFKLICKVETNIYLEILKDEFKILTGRSPRFLCRLTALIKLLVAVQRQSVLYTENSGFASPTLGQHISTFRAIGFYFLS